MKTEKAKPLIWIGSSLEDLRKFPEAVKNEIGYALFRAQEGKKYYKTKPLKGFSGVFEIVSSYQTDAYRTVYAIKLGDDIYVLHAFRKKSAKGRKTPRPDMEIIRKRLREAQVLAREKTNER